MSRIEPAPGDLIVVTGATDDGFHKNGTRLVVSAVRTAVTCKGLWLSVKGSDIGIHSDRVEVVHRFVYITTKDSAPGTKWLACLVTERAKVVPETNDSGNIENLLNHLAQRLALTWPWSTDRDQCAEQYRIAIGRPVRVAKVPKVVDDSMPGVSRDELRERLRTKNKHLTEVLKENRLLQGKLTDLRTSLALRTQELDDQAARSLRLKEHVAKLEAEVIRLKSNGTKPVDMLEAFTTYCAVAGLTFAITNRTK